MYTITYDQDVIKKDIPHLDKKIKEIIKKTIEKKLMTHPEIFGIPLRSNLAGYRKLRIGDYRVVFTIKKQVVDILVICHRSEVYQIASTRM
jgi:mRNA interferase RelE/StbE